MSENGWHQGAEGVMQPLLDAQHVLWQAWTDIVSKTYEKELSFSELADKWQKHSMESVKAWGSAVDPIVRSTAEQFIATQGNALRFLDLVARNWETAAPKMKSAKDWQNSFSGMQEEFRRLWLNMPAEASAINQDIESIWKVYTEQWRSFGQPWEGLLMGAPALFGRAVTGDTSAMFEFSDVFHTAYKQTLGRFTSSPNLGITREINSRLMECFDAFAVLNLATIEYKAVVGEIWEAAFKQFGEDLAVLVEKGQKIDKVRDLVSFWTRSAESVFLAALGGERYTLAQGKLLNANMQYRISRRRIMDKYLEACDMPTRREVDEVHRRIYELNKEVKLLKKTLAEMKRAEPRTEVMVELMPEARAEAKPEVKRSRTSREKKEN